MAFLPLYHTTAASSNPLSTRVFWGRQVGVDTRVQAIRRTLLSPQAPTRTHAKKPARWGSIFRKILRARTWMGPWRAGISRPLSGTPPSSRTGALSSS
eukprot:537766-Rhodomonas_salina.1